MTHRVTGPRADAPTRGTGWRPWLAPLALAAVALAAVLLLVRPDGAPPAGTVISRGGTGAIEAVVARGGRRLLTATPLDELPALEDGDQMMLRVRDGAGAYLRLEAKDQGLWRGVFDGLVPPDGVIPLGLTVTRAGETALRAALCDAPPDPGPAVFVAPGDACAVATWTLEVR